MCAATASLCNYTGSFISSLCAFALIFDIEPGPLSLDDPVIPCHRHSVRSPLLFSVARPDCSPHIAVLDRADVQAVETGAFGNSLHQAVPSLHRPFPLSIASSCYSRCSRSDQIGLRCSRSLCPAYGRLDCSTTSSTIVLCDVRRNSTDLTRIRRRP
ncbi:hypothetical protein DENSPDRAFT_65148 [Dentipellis sp. KUC8613]|nr:hypothetical protein DENSPDRAFT_65148 [Dentipellis sp. KUC8613]